MIDNKQATHWKHPSGLLAVRDLELPINGDNAINLRLLPGFNICQLMPEYKEFGKIYDVDTLKDLGFTPYTR